MYFLRESGNNLRFMGIKDPKIQESLIISNQEYLAMCRKLQQNQPLQQ